MRSMDSEYRRFERPISTPIGFDIERHDYGSGTYLGELVLRFIRQSRTEIACLDPIADIVSPYLHDFGRGFLRGAEGTIKAC